MNLKVLAIDDDHAMTELLTLLLKTHGFNVLTANTGEDGVSLALKESPDVIILDLMMPGMDGWQVCNQIRTFSSCAHPGFLSARQPRHGGKCPGRWRGRLPGQTRSQRGADRTFKQTDPPAGYEQRR